MFAQFVQTTRSFVASRLALVIAVAAIGLHPSPSAAEWRVAPSLGVGIEYDDNASLIASSTQSASVNGYLLEAEAAITYSSPLTNFVITPSLLLRRYDDDLIDLDSDDYFLDFNYGYAGKLSSFQFRGNFSDESVRTSERSDVNFEIEDPDQIQEDDSGRVLGREQRQRFQLNPQWSYELGQRSRVRVGANHIDVSYDNSLAQSYIDYQETSGRAGLEYDWSERNTVSLSGYYRENQFADTSRDFSGSGVTVGLTRSLTEKTRFILNIGVDSSEDELGKTQTNPIGELSLTHRLQTSRILASYRRIVTGNGTGETALRDSVTLNITRDISERFSIGAGVRAYQTNALDENLADPDEKDYLQLRALFTWNLTRVFSADLDYSYTTIDRKNSPSDADSNRIDLWFRYRPQLR